MLRFRLILAWLVLAALPLQGWAAASMLFCGPAQRAAVHAKAQAAKAAPAGDHAMHAGHHDMQGAHGQHHADAGTADAEAGGPAQPVTDSTHTCGVCAACCHAVALAQTMQWAGASDAPGAHLAEPLVTVLARPSPVPDKPPRA